MNETTNVSQSERVLVLPDSKFASVLRVRVSLRCNNCGNQWGVSFNNDTLRLPLAFDVCNVCGKKQGG